MVKIDDLQEIEYKRAACMLNYDKYGTPNGLDSLGVLIEIPSDKNKALQLYIGIKNDVISVYTNAFASTFINVPKKLQIYKNYNETYTEWGDPDDIITFYVDLHKVKIDMRQFYSYVYGDESSKSAFNAIVQNNIFKTHGNKTARAITMHPTLQFEGNLENIGIIATEDKALQLINEMIIDKKMISDEIIYSNWFVPRDLETWEYDAGNNLIKFERGDFYSDGLNGIVDIAGNSIPSFTYDRRGFRNGYWDLKNNPTHNTGFILGDTEYNGTYFFRPIKNDDVDIKEARFVIPNSIGNEWISKINLVLSDGRPNNRYVNPITLSAETFKIVYSYAKNYSGSWKDFFKGDVVDEIIEKIAQMVCEVSPSQDIINAAKNILQELYIPPIYCLNIDKKTKILSVDDLNDSIIFIYHPILNKYFFYQVDGFADGNIEIDSNGNPLVNADGFKYGVSVDGNKGVFVWSNIEKDFRISPKNISFRAVADDNLSDTYTYTFLDGNFEDNLDSLKSCAYTHQDLIYNSKGAHYLVVKTSDIRDVIKKQYGICDSKYAFGIKYGYVKIV